MWWCDTPITFTRHPLIIYLYTGPFTLIIESDLPAALPQEAGHIGDVEGAAFGESRFKGGVELRQALVVGAGIAGISTALSLADRGIFVNLIDVQGTIGGRAKELSCKGLRECVRCDVCLATDKIQEVGRSEMIRVFPHSSIRSISGAPGSFRITLDRYPSYVDEQSCTACGVCTDACPVDAIGPPAMGLPITYAIDASACLRFSGEECRECETACPHGAIDLSMSGSIKRLQVGAVVVATGFTPIDPDIEPRYRHDLIQGVISSLEAERALLLKGALELPDGTVPERVAFIQCVGSSAEL